MSKNKRSEEASVGTRTATETMRKRSTLRKKSKFRSGEAEEHKEEESKSLTRSAIRTDERSAEVTAGTERKTKSEKRSKFRPSRKGKDAKEEKELGIFPFRPARMDSFSLSKRASTRSLTRLDEYSGNATDDASVADLTYAKMPSLHIIDIAREVRGLPSMRRAVVRVADMPDEMQQDAVDCSAHALELYGSEEERAAYIKKEFDKKYQATWHCVVGSDYGTYVTHDNRHFIFFFIGKMAILLFRS